MAKTRSPNYPQLDFAEAMEKARIIYKSAHQHSISDEEIAAALGYMSLNGRSMSVISAVKKYGLLIPSGDGFKISEDAFNVFELPSESKEHIESLKKMAYSPQIFVELRETYGEQLPSDQILRHYLIKNKFNPNVADEVVKNFRATIELITHNEEKYNESIKPAALQTEVISPELRHRQYYNSSSSMQRQQSIYNATPEVIEVNEISKELKFSLSDESEVQVIFRGNVSSNGVRKLIKLLEVSFDLQIEPQQPPVQRSLPLGQEENKEIVQELEAKLPNG
jgi:hypothetical protein